MAEKNQPSLCSSNGDVETTIIGEEAHLTSFVGSNRGEHDDFLFSPLIPVNALDFESGIRLTGFPSARHLKQAHQFPHLSVVGRNHTDVLGLKVAHGQ